MRGQKIRAGVGGWRGGALSATALYPNDEKGPIGLLAVCDAFLNTTAEGETNTIRHSLHE
jgi:hypothetical protein